MSKYLTLFEISLNLYKNKSLRPGYTFGYFSFLRHSYSLYPHIQQLQNDLVSCDDDINAKNILIAFFKSTKTKLDNHSFATYFLDQLCKTYPNERWEEFYPKEKRVKFYTGILYRGTLQSPKDALKNGIERVASQNIEDYANDTNLHIGVSTSKDKLVAERYQTSTFMTAKGAYYQKGFLYKINYRDQGGIDILETLQERGHDLTAAIASHKDEVNIIGKIVPQDIVGYWDQKGSYHANAEYVEDRALENGACFPERLNSLFKMSS